MIFSNFLRVIESFDWCAKNLAKQINLDGSKLIVTKNMELFVKRQSLHNLLHKDVKYTGKNET